LDNAVVAFNKLIARVAALKPEGEVDEAVLAEYKEKFNKVMGNDLNTSMGVTAVYDVLKAKTNDATKLAALADFDKVLSLNMIEAANALRAKQEAQAAAEAEESDPEIDALIAERTAAKKAKNFAEADRIRDELLARGIEIIDTRQGTKWKRI
jgi:cysteinyl-tRNA synthetase